MRRRQNKGFTLIEVVIGMLLIALMIGPLFSVALTARQSKTRVDKKQAAAIAGNRVLDRLKLYVTADPLASSGPGPNGSWTLPGDSYTGAGGALGVGVHDLSAADWLPQELKVAGGKISYTVTKMNVDKLGTVTQPSVTLTITWDQPATGGVGVGVGVGVGTTAALPVGLSR